jgi:hypothetical protein
MPSTSINMLIKLNLSIPSTDIYIERKTERERDKERQKESHLILEQKKTKTLGI